MQMRILSGLSVKDLALGLWHDLIETNVLGTAAELAYYFILALFPMLIFLTSLVGFLSGVRETIFSALAYVAPGEAMQLVNQTLNDVVSKRSGGLLSFGILGALWAASGGVAALINGLNEIYRVKEGRSFVRVRLIAIGLTILLALLVIAGTSLIVFGDKVINWLAEMAGMSDFTTFVTGAVHYLSGIAMVILGLGVIYYAAPNVQQSWKWITPGSVFAILAMLIVSSLFSLYLRIVPDYSATYGSLGAAIVLLLWLYLIGLVLLLGGDINARIREAAGKPTIEKEEETSEK
jgi:membrane protein